MNRERSPEMSREFMKKTEFFELEDLVYAKSGHEVYRYNHEGRWEKVEAEKQDEIDSKLKFDADKIDFNQVKSWVEKHGLIEPPDRIEN